MYSNYNQFKIFRLTFRNIVTILLTKVGLLACESSKDTTLDFSAESLSLK